MKHDDSETDAAPLDCAAARLSASAWIDGELAATAELAAHLAGCEGCRAHADDLRALRTRFAALASCDRGANAPGAAKRAGERDLWPAIAARTRALPAAGAQRGARPQPARGIHVRRVAAALLGCAGTAGLLEAAARFAARPDDGRAAHWAAALHDGQGDWLAASPERRLLAALQGAPEERR